MDAVERDLEFRLYPEALEGLEHDGGRKYGLAYRNGCQWTDLRWDRYRFRLRIRL